MEMIERHHHVAQHFECSVKAEMEWRVRRKEKVTKYAIIKVLLAYEEITVANLTGRQGKVLSFFLHM